MASLTVDQFLHQLDRGRPLWLLPGEPAPAPALSPTRQEDYQGASWWPPVVLLGLFAGTLSWALAVVAGSGPSLRGGAEAVAQIPSTLPSPAVCGLGAIVALIAWSAPDTARSVHARAQRAAGWCRHLAAEARRWSRRSRARRCGWWLAVTHGPAFWPTIAALTVVALLLTSAKIGGLSDPPRTIRSEPVGDPFNTNADLERN